MRRTLQSLAVVAFAASLGWMSAAPASADTSYAISVTGPATLVAKGAGISVPVAVTCPADAQNVQFQLHVEQIKGNHPVSGGYANAIVECTGAPQTFPVIVDARGTPFQHGSVQATAFLFNCGAIYTASCSDTETIRVR